MKLKITFLTLFIVTGIFAQSIEDLKRDNEALYEATYNMSFDTMLDFTYPLVFRFVERADMYAALDSSFDNDTYSIQYLYTTPHFSYSNIQMRENGLYCVISYENSMVMTYKQPINNEATLKRIMETLHKNFPNSTIRFSKEINAFNIIKIDKLVAISDDFTEGRWKFVSFDPNYKELLDAVITEKVRKQLGL
ncbi:hypothetical protein FEDK69T_23090 [Flavobacterium enshiense DK69]|uniref:Uncharacterized protein n=1 Tax=Flavobacterium enshiense DK69 TaxID=1107311 RepID=V6SD41_9FLAO|nr:hypothetical protein [Flavobacterium enshiense]ESU22325.1 hypothetical protein FEDK69T_23090 [Flavobacterium enshiense DK69]KGO97330.1 hypothetical protein Q767_01655 [Flavobacterium enshiense DK69]